jgi:hypothetical protein
MRRRHAAYLTVIVPVAILALIVFVLDPGLSAAAENPELTARIQLDMVLFGAVGLGSLLISVMAVDSWGSPA